MCFLQTLDETEGDRKYLYIFVTRGGAMMRRFGECG